MGSLATLGFTFETTVLLGALYLYAALLRVANWSPSVHSSRSRLRELVGSKRKSSGTTEISRQDKKCAGLSKHVLPGCVKQRMLFGEWKRRYLIALMQNAPKLV